MFLPWQSDLMSITTCPLLRHTHPRHQPARGHLWPDTSVPKAWPHTGLMLHGSYGLVYCRPSTSQFIRLTLALISLGHHPHEHSGATLLLCWGPCLPLAGPAAAR